MYEDFFEMKKTPFVRSIPVDDLYMDQETGDRRPDFEDAASQMSRLIEGLYGAWAKRSV